MSGTLEDVDRLVLSLKADVCAQAGALVAARFEICTAEALANIVKHATPISGAGGIDVDLTLGPDAVTIEIFDPQGATPFDLRDHAPSLNDVDPLAESGRGLGLIMQCADAVEYGPADGRNKLTLTFRNTPE